MSRLDLNDYGISMKTGFILENPLTRLPPYFDPWNNVALRFAELVANKTMREEVEKLPVLDFTKLNGEREVKLGHLELVVMTSGYLWQNGYDSTQVPTVLPKCLAVPLYGMYEKYDLQPVITYADLLLNNTVLKDSNGPIQLENITSIIDAPADKQEWDWFMAVSYMVEYEFAKALPAVQNILDGVDETDETKITTSLKQIQEAVQNMQKTAALFHVKLTTEGFFPKLTTFFGGYGEMALHDGLIFEGVNAEPVKTKGANAGQTSTMKVLDALLGIEHPKDRTEHVEKIMKYIPPKHRNFIKAVRARPKQLKLMVESSSNSEMKEAYTSLIQAIHKFRTYHVQIVTKYMIQGIKKNIPEEKQEGLKPMKESAVERSYVGKRAINGPFANRSPYYDSHSQRLVAMLIETGAPSRET